MQKDIIFCYIFIKDLVLLFQPFSAVKDHMIGVSTTKKVATRDKGWNLLRQLQNFHLNHVIKDADYFGSDNVASSDFLCPAWELVSLVLPQWVDPC